MKWAKSILVFCLWMPTVICCQSRSSQTNLMDTNIREADQPVRVIYRTGDTVFLVTCPLEKDQATDQVNDHIVDEKFLDRASCNETNAAKDASGKPLVQTMAYTTKYLPKLKEALDVRFTNRDDIGALRKQIDEQQKKLDKLLATSLRANAASNSFDTQIKNVTEKLADLRDKLGPDGLAEANISLLDTLIGYLDANSKAAFNIEETEAGKLLEPFRGPAGIIAGDGNQGGGGYGGGGGINQPTGYGSSFSTCPTLPDNVKRLNVSFSKAYIAEARDLEQARANQRLCVAVADALDQLVKESPKLSELLVDRHFMVVIDAKDKPVAFDPSESTLTLPYNISRHTRVDIANAMKKLGVDFPCGPGKKVNGSCWYLSNNTNESCNDVCNALGKEYDPMTVWAGSGDTKYHEHCATVGAAFNSPFASNVGCLLPKCAGCVQDVDDGKRRTFRCYDGNTTAECSSGYGRYRYCACY